MDFAALIYEYISRICSGCVCLAEEGLCPPSIGKSNYSRIHYDYELCTALAPGGE